MNIIKILLSLLIISTVFFQLPFCVEYLRYYDKYIWFFVCILLLLFYKKNVRIPLKFFFLLLFVIIYIKLFSLVCMSFLNYDYGEYFYSLTLFSPLVSYMCGLLFYQHISDNLIEKNFKLYTFFILILSINVFYSFFGSFSVFLNSDSYLYKAKNLLGQFIFSALLIIVGIKRKDLILKIMFVLLLILGLIIQCRSAILAFIISLLLCYSYTKKNRKFMIMFFLSIIILLIFSNFFSLLVNKSLMLYKLDYLDDFSSNRIAIYKFVWNHFLDNFFVGYPIFNIPIDSFYLGNLAFYGIVGGLPIIIMWFIRFFINLKQYLYYKNNLNDFFYISFSLTIFFTVVGFFEGGGPVSPITTNFMWLLFGYLDSYIFNKGCYNKKEFVL